MFAGSVPASGKPKGTPECAEMLVLACQSPKYRGSDTVIQVRFVFAERELSRCPSRNREI